MSAVTQPAELRQATEADLPSIHRVTAAAYRKYLSRMDKPPAPAAKGLQPSRRNWRRLGDRKPRYCPDLAYPDR
jgi:hypothetical protein